MDEIVNRIIYIDNETISMRLKTEELIDLKEKELKETLQALEKKYMEEGRLEGEVIYKEIILKGETEIERLKFQDEATLDGIDRIYKESKTALIEELWDTVFRAKE